MPTVNPTIAPAVPEQKGSPDVGPKGYNRQWTRHGEQQWHQHSRRGGAGGPWGGWGPGAFGRPGNAGPPPWVAGLFGLAQGERGRGPRVRRGDVRSAILDVVRTAESNGEEINGYQVIQQIAERSKGAWRPSPVARSRALRSRTTSRTSSTPAAVPGSPRA